MYTIEYLQTISIQLLQDIIAISSFSKEEDNRTKILIRFFEEHHIVPHRYLNNLWATNQHFSTQKPTLFLNSHHDTVQPNKGYTRNPFEATIIDNKLYGLGSNDAGGALVSLIATFLYFYDHPSLPYNICIGISAEEEISGSNGIEALLSQMPPCTCGIVGEPTLTQLAISEKGLMVVDAVSKGISGHAARNEGKNALYIALADITWIQQHQFDKISHTLGPVKMTVTAIHTPNQQHNVVPSLCYFTIDIRVNELYSFQAILQTLQQHLQSDVTPRSMRLRSTIIEETHPLVVAGQKIGKQVYGSPTTSDKALIPFPMLKMGPGDSARSHSADEFIFVSEIQNGIIDYIDLIKAFMKMIPTHI